MHSKSYQGQILAVTDSSFKVVSLASTMGGTLEVLLPLTLESRKIWAYSLRVTRDTFGQTAAGIN